MHKKSRVKSDNDLISVSLVLRAFHPLTADESSARIRNEELGIRNEGGGFAEILRLRSQLFWHSLSHIRRFSPLRMTKRGDARLRLRDQETRRL